MLNSDLAGSYTDALELFIAPEYLGLFCVLRLPLL
jgi:hypothetical protein